MLVAAAPFAGAQRLRRHRHPAAPWRRRPRAAARRPVHRTEASYLFGLTFAEQLHGVGITNQLNRDAIDRGIKDGLAGKKSTRANQQQVQEYVQSVDGRIAGRATRRRQRTSWRRTARKKA